MQCQRITNKQQCKAQAILGESFCFVHNPNYEEKRKEASSKGGIARRHTQSYLETDLILKSPQDVQKLIETSINLLLRGKMPSSNPGSQVAYLANTWLSAYEKHGLEQRIKNIEERLGQDYGNRSK